MEEFFIKYVAIRLELLMDLVHLPFHLEYLGINLYFIVRKINLILTIKLRRMYYERRTTTPISC